MTPRRALSFSLIGLVAVAAGVWLVPRLWTIRGMPTANSLPDNRPVPSQPGPGQHPSQTSSRAPGPISFTWLRDGTGVEFRHDSGDGPEKPFPSANGSGVAVLDYDRDGEFDLYFATGTDFPLDPKRAVPMNRLYRGRAGWRFGDVTARAGVGHNGFSAGLAVGDYDNDGFSDVFVNCFGPDVLYRNQGDGTFVRIADVGGRDTRWGTSAAFFDFDRDGDLDLYVCNYGDWTLETNRFCGDHVRKIRTTCSPNMVAATPHILWENLGDGRFEDASHKTGIDLRPGRGQGVVASDLNDDGWIDLYVGNDLHANAVFRNDMHGHFVDETESSGAGYEAQGRAQASMGVEAVDVNGDGLPELFVTNFEGDHNSMYENTGGLVFQEVSRSWGLAAASMPWVGWGTALVDFDLDGWPDAIVTNGHVDNNLKELGKDSPWEQPPLLFHNQGQGRFRFLGGSGGLYFQQSHPGRGLATADFDHDGDLDVVISHQDRLPALLQNDRREPGDSPVGWIGLRLIGTRSNRDAVGAKISLTTSLRTIVQQINGGGSYASANDLRQHFAVPLNDKAVSAVIRWPNGHETHLDSLLPGQVHDLVEPAEQETGSEAGQ